MESIECNGCSGEAELVCAICKKSRFCSMLCKRNSHEMHKYTCVPPELDRTIHRAGALLREMFLLFSERAFSYPISGIHRTDDHIQLVVDKNPQKQIQCFHEFPQSLVAGIEEKQKILSSCSCLNMVAYLHDLVIDMLRGTSCEIHALEFLAQRPTQTMDILSDPPLENPIMHVAIVVSSSGGSYKRWVLDPIGLRISNPEAVMDYQDYTEQYIDGLTEEFRWKGRRRIIMTNLKQRGFPDSWRRVTALEKGIRLIEMARQSVKEECELPLRTLLRSDQYFDDHRTRVLTSFKRALDYWFNDMITYGSGNLVPTEESTEFSEELLNWSRWMERKCGGITVGQSRVFSPKNRFSPINQFGAINQESSESTESAHSGESSEGHDKGGAVSPIEEGIKMEESAV